jgi:hypothetical protein
MAIANTRLTTTSPIAVYICTRPQGDAVTTIIACNTGSVNLSDETVNETSLTMFLVPNGSLVGDNTTIVKNLIIPAGETVFFSDEKVILGNGDSVYAQATNANLLTITVSILPV